MQFVITYHQLADTNYQLKIPITKTSFKKTTLLKLVLKNNTFKTKFNKKIYKINLNKFLYKKFLQFSAWFIIIRILKPA